ncbi:MAG: PilZ domain-containing protein [Myxococcales bacterium]|nr:PilZ domain-containing protein [Myxococcales bacterium]
MSGLELQVEFADVPALVQEFESNLRHGRAFVRAAVEAEALSNCQLILVHPQSRQELALGAQIVFVGPGGASQGVGVELRPFDDATRERLRAFVLDPHDAEALESEPAAAGDGGQSITLEAPSALASEAFAPTGAAPSQPAGEPSEDQRDPDPDTFNSVPDEASDGALDEVDPERLRGPTRNEIVRKLSLTEQQKLARSGELQDRVLLERYFGKNVWEHLLRNPRLTVPEVARIARKGTVPRPLLDLIVDNNAWIQAPPVRRALLGNTRVSYEGIVKLLRITPKQELKSIHKTTAYPNSVREAARKLLGQ